MDAVSLLKCLRQELASLHDELVRIRVLLEQIESAEVSTSNGSFETSPETAAEPPPGSPAPPAASSPQAAPLPAAAALAATALAPPAVPPPSSGRSAERASAAASLDPSLVELFAQLLSLYPGDAAAVFYGFDRLHRCSPELLDRLAARAGLESEWLAANRNTIGALAIRFHGGRELIAEALGRDTDSLQALLDRIGMNEQMEAVRARERDRLRSAALAERVNRLLFRRRLLRDLGVLDELEESTRQELQGRCAELSGECEGVLQVLERLGQECSLDSAARARLVRRFDLQRFVADLFSEPRGSVRPAARRAERAAEPRQPLADEEIEARMLRMLLSKRKVGAAHTHIDHLVRTVPPHERGRAREIIERLLADGTLVRKVTDNSAEPHVSLAVTAVPAVEGRLRESRSAGAVPQPEPLRGDRAT